MVDFNLHVIFDKNFDYESFLDEFKKLNIFKDENTSIGCIYPLPIQRIENIDGLPNTYSGLVDFRFYSYSSELYESGIYTTLIENILKKFKEHIIEIDAADSCDIYDGWTEYYYIKSFELFVQAVVYERWGFNIVNQEKEKQMLKEYINNNGFLNKDESIFWNKKKGDLNKLFSPKDFCEENFLQYKEKVPLDFV